MSSPSPPPSPSQIGHFGHVAQVTRCTVKLRWYLDLVSLFRQSGCSFSNENAPLVESATKWLCTVYTAATTVRILHHTFHTVLCFTLIPRRLQSLSPSFSRLGLHSHCDTFQNQLNPDRCTITSSTRVLVSSLLSPVLKGWHKREIAKYVTDQSANHTDKNTSPFLKNDFRGAWIPNLTFLDEWRGSRNENIRDWKLYGGHNCV